MSLKKNKIGILGGSFDPAHKGHLAISREAIKRFNLKKVIWAITKKNPLKKKSFISLENRIKHCRKVIGTNNLIKVKFYENINQNKDIGNVNKKFVTKKLEKNKLISKFENIVGI